MLSTKFSIFIKYDVYFYRKIYYFQMLLKHIYNAASYDKHLSIVDKFGRFGHFPRHGDIPHVINDIIYYVAMPYHIPKQKSY